MRIVKEAEERKNEILDAAGTLFAQKGFDGTSTADILEKVGIARGTLYYHFKSKEDIMDALIQRTTSQLLGTAKEIASDKDVPVMERIIAVVLSLNISSGNATGKAMLEHIHSPQNALMHEKIRDSMIGGVTPILTEIIKEGIDQGLCSTPFPYECMEMIMVYTNTVFDGSNMEKLSAESQNTRIQAFAFNVERLLGMPEKGFHDAILRIFDGGP